jgi:hypothetical protein
MYVVVKSLDTSSMLLFYRNVMDLTVVLVSQLLSVSASGMGG